MATYAVGDIQGCYDSLLELLDKVNFDQSQDRLWAVGDLVNRGPHSLQTLRFLKSLGPAFFSVQGNHDLHLLALAAEACTEGKKQFLQPILNAPDRDELCDWLRAFPLLRHELVPTETGLAPFLLVHAGLAPSWSLEQALGYAAEVEAVLHSPTYPEFLAAMYGDEPDIWDDSLKGMERLRVITNYFTRIRFCNAQGKLKLSIKTGLESAPAGYKPWYEYQQLNQQLTILFGHWAAIEGRTNTDNIYALDTGCVWGRCLTMLRLEDRQLFSVECQV